VRVGRRAQKVARGETSGLKLILDCALKVRSDVFARLQRADPLSWLIQTFHVWLPSSRRCRGEESLAPL